jgi:hypothetical protein
MKWSDEEAKVEKQMQRDEVFIKNEMYDQELTHCGLQWSFGPLQGQAQ